MIIEIEGKKYVMSKEHAQPGALVMLIDMSIHSIVKTYPLQAVTSKESGFKHLTHKEYILLTPVKDKYTSSSGHMIMDESSYITSVE